MWNVAYPEDFNELCIADWAIFIQVEGIENGPKLLRCQESAKLVKELIELLSLQGSILLPVKSGQGVPKLLYIVNTFSVELELDLVDDLW